jgi:hypothetical protein
VAAEGRMASPNMGLRGGQCRDGVLPVGGNFCRDRHELPVFPNQAEHREDGFH